MLLKLYYYVMEALGFVFKRLLKHHAKRRGVCESRYCEFWGLPTQKAKEIQVWGHAVSVGEARSLLTLFDFLSETYPEWKFLVTTTTATAAQIVDSHGNVSITHQYFPFDVPRWIHRFLDYWNPQTVILMEQEIWPNLIQICHDRGVKTCLVNGRMTDKSMQNWKKISHSVRKIMSGFDVILAQSFQDQRNWQEVCGSHRVKCVGNLKLAAQPLGSDPMEKRRLQSVLKGRPFWVAASLHVGEENIVLSTHTILSNYNKALLTILIPRHPDMRKSYQQACDQAGLKYALRSKSDDIKPDTDVYIVDTMGELGLFYSISEVALIGGSLIPNVGGHNPIEAANLHTAVVTGPYVHNFSDVYKDMLKERAVTIVKGTEDLAQAVMGFLKDGKLVKRAQTQAFNYAQSHNPLESVYEAIQDFLPVSETKKVFKNKNEQKIAGDR